MLCAMCTVCSVQCAHCEVYKVRSTKCAECIDNCMQYILPHKLGPNIHPELGLQSVAGLYANTLGRNSTLCHLSNM